jgi:ABC-type branched-subunit amino acid transport system substrate-binding protein
VKNRSLISTGSTLGVLAAVAVLLSFVTMGTTDPAPGPSVNSGSDGTGTQPEDVSGTPTTLVTAGGDNSGAPTANGGKGGGQDISNVKGPDADCAKGLNAGATDVGVTGKSIKLASTIVTDGPGSSFLGPVRFGMNAVVNQVNRSGGVCGRLLDLSLRNDSWVGTTGQRYIENFVESDKVFALAVVPSSEGLYQSDRYIREQGVPVVGTDGMLIHQYRNPWIWPVATPTISAMHIMAKNAYDRSMACQNCSHEFGIVFDAHYHFGVEGAFAFNQAIKRLTGKDIRGFDPELKSCKGRFCGIQPNQSSYATDASSFYDECGMGNKAVDTRCDFVAVLLEPETALTWFSSGRTANPLLDPSGFGAAQPLFNRQFAEKCGQPCDGMWVWTGYQPPIERYANQPATLQYVNDLRAEQPTVDATNQFVEGGYIGMQLLVKALTTAGSQLTRAHLKQVLDSMEWDSGLAAPFAWKSGNHFSNTAARAFSIQYRQGFNGWRQQVDALIDPWVGQDDPNKN